jgi:hypothetical protein
MLQFSHLGIRTRGPKRLGRTVCDTGYMAPSGSAPIRYRSNAERDCNITGEINHGRVVWCGLLELLQDSAELEEQRAVGVRHHTLDPEKRREPHATRQRRDVMHAGGRIEQHVAGRQFDGTLAQPSWMVVTAPS